MEPRFGFAKITGTAIISFYFHPGQMLSPGLVFDGFFKIADFWRRTNNCFFYNSKFSNKSLRSSPNWYKFVFYSVQTRALLCELFFSRIIELMLMHVLMVFWLLFVCWRCIIFSILRTIPISTHVSIIAKLNCLNPYVI